MTREIDGPFKSFRAESGLFKHPNCQIDIRCNDQIDIGCGHRLLSPVVDHQATDHTLRDFMPLQSLDQKHDIAAAACGLPIVKFPARHAATVYKSLNGDKMRSLLPFARSYCREFSLLP